jgi:hypothetical protein
MILIALALGAAPAPAGEDAELAAVRAALPAAVEAAFPDYERSPEDLASPDLRTVSGFYWIRLRVAWSAATSAAL